MTSWVLLTSQSVQAQVSQGLNSGLRLKFGFHPCYTRRRLTIEAENGVASHLLARDTHTHTQHVAKRVISYHLRQSQCETSCKSNHFNRHINKIPWCLFLFGIWWARLKIWSQKEEVRGTSVNAPLTCNVACNEGLVGNTNTLQRHLFGIPNVCL